MARPLKLATTCTSMFNTHSRSSVFISKLNSFACQRNSTTRTCSSQNVYKIDHSGFVNGLEPDPPRNDQLGIRDKIVNRNPRVLEHLNYARSQEGWRFQAPRRNYTNKLVLEMTGRNVLAYIQHKSGEKVIWASSEEHSLKKRLYSLSDVSAVKAVARVFARRCLKAGLTKVAVIESAETRQSERFTVFSDILTGEGIALSEPAEVLPPHRLGIDYDVFDPNRYANAEAEDVVWPQSREEYDPDIDVLWVNEGIERKHQFPEKKWEDYRPLVDPEPKVFPKAGSSQDEIGAEKAVDPKLTITEVEGAIKLLD